MMTRDEEISYKYHYKVGMDATIYEDWQESVEEIIPNLDGASNIALGNIDYTMLKYWMTNIYTFPPSENELDEIQLKHSLKCSLNLVPALSGRLKPSSGKPYDFQSPPKDLHIELGNASAWWTSQSSELSFNEIISNFNDSESTIQPIYLFQAAQREIKSSVLPPLLAIKLLKSSDNGYILTVMRNHLIVDGKSNILFLKMWSQFYRKETIDPIIDNRSLYSKSNEVNEGAQQYLDEWALPRETYNYNFEVQTVKFSILKSDMLELKQSCLNEYSSTEDWVSSDDILNVIIWRVFMRACKFNKKKLTGFQRVVDIRKLNQLPSNSYGNGVMLFIYPEITIQQLLETPLATLTLNFRKYLQKIATPSKVEDFLIALSHTQHPDRAAQFINSSDSPCILASSTNKFNPGDLYFHEPATTSLRCPYLPGRLFTQFPTATHYEARIGVPTKDIPELLQDSELKKWKIEVKVTSPPLKST